MDARESSKIAIDQGDGPTAEFVALREEMQERFKAQQTLLSLQLTLVATIFGFAISQRGIATLMLIVPFSSYLLCGRQVAQHFAGQRIAQYIAEELTPRVTGGLGWEQWLRSRERPLHLLGSTLPLLLTYTGASLLALAWTFSSVFLRLSQSVDSLIGFAVLWLLGLVATVLSTVLVLQMADRITAASWERASLS
jgi:hypothetical protein